VVKGFVRPLSDEYINSQFFNRKARKECEETQALRTLRTSRSSRYYSAFAKFVLHTTAYKGRFFTGWSSAL
jgi:hypothetical protein